MAIIKCPECGKEVSDKAWNCPECGCPLTPVSGASTTNQQSTQSQNAYVAPVRSVVSNSGSAKYSSPQDKPPVWKTVLCVVLLLLGPLAIVGVILMWVWKVPAKKGIRIALTVFGIIMFLAGVSRMGKGGSDSQGGATSASKTPATTEVAETAEPSSSPSEKEERETSATVSTEPVVPAVDPIVGEKTSFKDLKVGEIGKKGDIYVGLQYVKTMTYLPTRLGKEDIPSGNEVILGFFEFYNGADKSITVDPSDVTCYVDGEQVDEVETYINVEVDGIGQFYNATLDAGCQFLSVQDFEVPKGWNEIKFFYKSDCVWTLSGDDVKTEDYTKTSLFEIDNAKPVTSIDEVIYSDKYDVQYKGTEIYHYKNSVTDENYVVFKYRITNNDAEALDTSLMGYNMRAYQNNFLLDGATYTMDDKVDGFINIYNIDIIESGMSSNIFLAFEVKETSGSFYMAYDDGYIIDHFCGTVYAQVD